MCIRDSTNINQQNVNTTMMHNRHKKKKSQRYGGCNGPRVQYTFVDRENDLVVTRISKYSQQDSGSTQKWGVMRYLKWAGIENAINMGRKLIDNGSINAGTDVITPYTNEDGESYEFYIKYPEVIESIADLSRN